ncbi:twin-arginine translocation signal domain-containing protein [Haloferax sp. ATB1]|uniref:twin-arginine translocation signal domain-containing protein n=1 Tax=Haloferax sp. ATB1 TaxID=1508454 RepID=UPI0005B21941|nr:twin-arginine translocation signal domain-containing protein [Haloferax sp. ATB1]
MERRTFLKSVAATGALLTTAGCMGGGSESQPTAGNETGNGTGGETTTEAEPAEVPDPELTFRTNSGVLRVVHMGGEKITADETSEVYVAVDDERATTWVDDSEETEDFPVSVGNFQKIESAETGSTVEVVWVGTEGAEEVLATHEVAAEGTATTTTANETTTNETTTNGTTTTTSTNETTMNETATTTTATNETVTTSDETTTSSGNETSN